MLKIISVLIFILLSIYSFLIIRFGIHMFQQNGYKNNVHLKWISSNRIRLFRECLNPRPSKKPLVYTPRVIRLFVTSALCFILCVIILALLPADCTYLAVFICIYTLIISPYVPVLSNLINSPIEKAISRGFIKKAMDSLESMPDLTVIGITGSYGKTSVKFYLDTLLSSKFEVLTTPESYNTPMGVVKTINTSLKPTHKIFLCEMGARNIGDIKEICDIVHPTHGIITSIGPQHLESFKTIGNIINTKFELADALPEDGKLFLNYDNEYIKSRDRRFNTITYSSLGNGDYNAHDINTSINGTTFSVTAPDGSSADFMTKLIGSHNVINIVGAIAVSNSLGIPLEDLKIPVRRLSPVEHRLNMIKRNGVTIIDDAYNSNPTGAKAALDTLSMFHETKILVTPGMVELGASEAELNRKFGEQAAVSADYIMLVGKKHTEPIAEGIISAGFDKDHLFITDTLGEAMEHAYTVESSGERVILLENDLPDNYN